MSTVSIAAKPRTLPKRADATAALETVTPAMAEEWLGKNDRNRSVRQSRVATYSHAMNCADWIITGEGIKFDWNGRLIDGQHRLLAIIDVDIPVSMFVFRGLHPDAQLVIDTGSKRTAADALKLAGLITVNTNEISSAAGIAIRWEEGFYNFAGTASGGREVTNSEILDWVRANADVVDACATAKLYHKPLYLAPSPLTFAVLQMMRIDHDATLVFLNNLRNMKTQGPGDPLFTLLRRLKQVDEDRESLRPAQVLFYLFRTWNAWRAGEELHLLKVGGAGKSGQIRVPDPR